jgi:hypothetical protein
MPKYGDLPEGQWERPPKNYKLACCDCGLVHKMDFRVVDGKVEFRVYRDERATAAIRRHLKKNE